MVGAVALGAQRPQFFPFVLQWDDGLPGPSNVAEWNAAPAGAHGPVVVRDGHFFAGDERIRFWGVNVSFAGGTPAKDDAEGVARRMAKFAINIVRFHHLDHPAPQGILAPRRPDTRSLDPAQLDRMDYFVSRLKVHGVYADLNLHVARKWTEADGVRDAAGLPDMGKYVSLFDPTIRTLMKEYARQLLTHVNPYTGKAYVDEPAVAMVEITNENSLLGGWYYGGLDSIPAYYARELQELWTGWLKKRYGSTERLRAAWSAGVEPLGAEMVAAGDFRDEPEKHWLIEQHEGAQARLAVAPAKEGEAPAAALTVSALSPAGAEWHVQLKEPGLKFEKGRLYTVSFRAWADGDRPLAVSVMQNHAPWQRLGLGQKVQLGREPKEYRFSFWATETESEDARLNFAAGSALGTVWLGQVSLRPGMEVLGEKESLEGGSVAPPSHSPGLASARLTDYIRFLNDLELDFFTDMRDFLRKDLGCRAPVTGTIGYGLPGIAVQAEMDFVDAHAYWQHPRFPHQPWSPTDWFVPNLAMVDDPQGSTLARLALGRVAGKPFTVTEYNHPAPNEFRAEAVPLIAAYGALQDWDGIFLYSYHHAVGEWDRQHIANYFDIDSDPGKMVQMPVGAAIFRRGDVSPAKGSCTYRLSRDQACMATSQSGLSPLENLRPAGHQPAFAFQLRTFLDFGGRGGSIESSGLPQAAPAPLRSDTGELVWSVAGERTGLVTVDTPRTKAVIGRLGGRKVELDGLTVSMPGTDSNFAAITLTAMDGKPLAESEAILVTAVGRVENTGMGWNAEHTSVSDKWGTSPTLAEGIAAGLVLRSHLRGATLSPLDSRGQPQGGSDVPSQAGSLSFSIGPEQQTLWYLLRVQQ
jgi:hypothetical protein